MDDNVKFLKKLCSYCIGNYQVMGSARIMSSFIYQCGKILDMELMAVEGILYVEINGYKRQYAHCFNTYGSSIIDASIYQFALIYKKVEDKFPVYIAGSIPEHIEYKVTGEIKYNNQLKFSDYKLNTVINEVKQGYDFNIDRFSLIEDSKKNNLFNLIK